MKNSLWLAGLLSMSCATNLSSLQTARTLPQGHVRVTGGLGVYVPAGQVVNTVSTGVALGKRASDALSKNEQFVFTEDDEQALLTAGIALAVLPPSPMSELSVRVGVVDNLDVGLKLSTNAIRADAKYRLFHSGADDLHPVASGKGIDAWLSRVPGGPSGDIAVGLGASYYFFKNPVTDLLGYVKMDDFKRFDLDGAVYLSWDASTWFSLYGAPRYVFSRTTMDQTLVRLSYEAGALVRTDIALPAQVDTHFVGATVGVRIGHPVVSVYLELTMGNTFAAAHVLGATRELGGFTVYPAGGLALAF